MFGDILVNSCGYGMFLSPFEFVSKGDQRT